MSLTEDCKPYKKPQGTPNYFDEIDALADSQTAVEYVRFSNGIVQECADAVYFRIFSVFEHMGLKIHPKHQRELANCVAKIMASNNGIIDRIFNIVKGAKPMGEPQQEHDGTDEASGVINHADMVRVLAKGGDEIIDTLTPEKMHSMHMAIGIAGEASGELLEALTTNEALYDRDNIIEELGDIEFYVEGLCQGLGITVEPYAGYTSHHSDINDMAIEISVIASSGILDTVKKNTIYNKDIDVDALMISIQNLKNEMKAVRDTMTITHEEVIAGNIAKLGERYKGFKYSDQQAHERADKKGE